MFFLTLLEHTIRIPPQSLNVPLMQAITVELQNLFVDKVIKDLGLCISVYDIRSLEGGFVFPGDGAPTFTIDFRLVMFRPFVGEVLVGKLKKSDKRGIYLSLGFFDDIHIPEHLLQQPSAFNEEENLWMWNYQGSELFMDLDEEVRFRVAQLKYPPIPVEQDNDSQPFAPMEIISYCRDWICYTEKRGYGDQTLEIIIWHDTLQSKNIPDSGHLPSLWKGNWVYLFLWKCSLQFISRI